MLDASKAELYSMAEMQVILISTIRKLTLRFNELFGGLMHGRGSLQF